MKESKWYAIKCDHQERVSSELYTLSWHPTYYTELGACTRACYYET